MSQPVQQSQSMPMLFVMMMGMFKLKSSHLWHLLQDLIAERGSCVPLEGMNTAGHCLPDASVQAAAADAGAARARQSRGCAGRGIPQRILGRYVLLKDGGQDSIDLSP